MAIASMNPRYVFTRDRLPAVVIYSIATALAAVLGFLTYRLFDNFQWFVDVKHHAGGFALVVDLALFLAKQFQLIFGDLLTGGTEHPLEQQIQLLAKQDVLALGDLQRRHQCLHFGEQFGFARGRLQRLLMEHLACRS